MVQEKIVRLIPSKTVKEKVTETKHNFSKSDLMLIVDRYAQSYDERMELMKILEGISDGTEKTVIQKRIQRYSENMEHFMSPEPNTVYELRIKLYPSDYREKYFCSNLESAVKTVKAFLKEYDCAEDLNEHSEIYLKKWRIFDDTVDFDHDSIGDLEFNEKLEIKTVSCWDKEYVDDGFDIIHFPDILEDFSPVRYYDNENGWRVFLQVKDFRPTTTEGELIVDEVYAFPLDEELNFDEEDFTFYYHEHLPLAEVELLCFDDLDDVQRVRAERLILFIKENYYK